MKYKIFLIIGLVLLNLGLIFASPSISVNNVYSIGNPYSSNYGKIIPVAKDTGDQLIAEVTVSDNSWADIKQVFLSWGDSSWVDCNRLSNTINSVNYKCILTVTPYMNRQTNVYVVARDYQGTSNVLLGNYNFQGQLFPVYSGTVTPTPINPPIVNPPPCPKQRVCIQYQTTCQRVCALRSRGGYCYYYASICKVTTNCLRYAYRTVCSR